MSRTAAVIARFLAVVYLCYFAWSLHVVLEMRGSPVSEVRLDAVVPMALAMPWSFAIVLVQEPGPMTNQAAVLLSCGAVVNAGLVVFLGRGAFDPRATHA